MLVISSTKNLSGVFSQRHYKYAPIPLNLPHLKTEKKILPSYHRKQYQALYPDKEKIQTLIDQQQRNLAEVDYLDLDYVAKMIFHFAYASTKVMVFLENPKIIKSARLAKPKL